MMVINWDLVEAVVFDMDGTLYRQSCLRRRMFFELFFWCSWHPERWRYARILREFRLVREMLGNAKATDVASRQYSEVADRLGQPVELVSCIVRTWILERPLRHIGACRFANCDDFFALLHRLEIKIAILSDYPAQGKMVAMGLEAALVQCTADPEVNRLKPHPRGLELVVERLGVSPEDCVMIGDRDDRDGACARALGMPFLLKAKTEGPGIFSDFGKLALQVRQQRIQDNF